jgi:hypothetical protein
MDKNLLPAWLINEIEKTNVTVEDRPQVFIEMPLIVPFENVIPDENQLEIIPLR